MNAPIYLKESDVIALKASLRRNMLGSEVGLGTLNRLKSIIEKSFVVPDNELPDQTIALGLSVHIEYCDDKERSRCRFVLPEHVADHADNISIYSPLGLALIGGSAGHVIDWPMTMGGANLQVKILHVERTKEIEQTTCMS